MHSYKVRAQNLSAASSSVGLLTKADPHKDFTIDTKESLEQLAARLSSAGFLDEGSGRWIMPGGILWIEKI